MQAKRESIQKSFGPFFTAATLAAHFKFQEGGFRQKDVRFLIELFTNWMDCTIGEQSLPLQNVQISRYLDSLAKAGYAQRSRGGTQPSYRITARGMTTLMGDLVNRPHFLPIDHVFFVYFFLKSYGPLFEKMVTEASAPMTPSLKAELMALRDPEMILQKQVRFLDKEIVKLKGRVEEAVAAARLGEKGLTSDQPLDEIVLDIQKRYPYELNNRKPLAELLDHLPEKLRSWEITTGMKNRSQILWAPLCDYLERTRESIQDLLQKAKEG